MNAVVFEHVPLSELPAAWRLKLPQMASSQVRVRIEEEESQPTQAVNPMYGMWKDRQDMADVPAYIEALRQSRSIPMAHAALSENCLCSSILMCWFGSHAATLLRLSVWRKLKAGKYRLLPTSN